MELVVTAYNLCFEITILKKIQLRNSKSRRMKNGRENEED